MSAEHGQASLEWIGLVLLVALALAALAGLTPLSARSDGADIALAGLRATKCAMGPANAPCAPRGGNENSRPARGSVATSGEEHGVTVPPLLPAPALGDAQQAGRPLRMPLLQPRVRALLRARFGAFWRRAWLACFAYERARYGLLHPETRVHQTVPIEGVVQMVNDCLSPIDFARDWEHLAPR